MVPVLMAGIPYTTVTSYLTLPPKPITILSGLGGSRHHRLAGSWLYGSYFRHLPDLSPRPQGRQHWPADFNRRYFYRCGCFRNARCYRFCFPGRYTLVLWILFALISAAHSINDRISQLRPFPHLLPVFNIGIAILCTLLLFIYGCSYYSALSMRLLPVQLYNLFIW